MVYIFPKICSGTVGGDFQQCGLLQSQYSQVGVKGTVSRELFSN